MVAFPPGSEVVADFIDQHDGFAVVIVAGNHTSNVQGHGRAFSAEKFRRRFLYCVSHQSAKYSDARAMISSASREIDVASLFDDRPIGGLQIRVFVLCALVALLDGVDSQAIGVAGPLIAAQLKMPPGTFSWAHSAGLFGATIGALIFGPIADYFGRRATLIFATALFGVFTCLTAL